MTKPNYSNNGKTIMLAGFLCFSLTYYFLHNWVQMSYTLFHLSYCLMVVGFGKMECKTKRDYNILLIVAFAVILLMNLGQVFTGIKDQYLGNNELNLVTFDDQWILSK